MKIRLLATFTVLFCLTAVGQLGLAQDQGQPLGKEQILLLLKQARQGRTTQGEIAAQVDNRGIAFSVDESLLDELKRAGARSFLIGAIKRAAQAAARRRERPPDAVGSDVLRGRGTGRGPGDEAEGREPLLEEARRHALVYLDELPNFIVTQTVRRSVQTPRRRGWELRDTLEVELRYRIDEGETFKLLRINGTPTHRSYGELGGSTSTGELGSMLAAVFSPRSRTNFKEGGRETFRGRPTIIYDFKVHRVHSSSSITDKNTGRTVVAGYSGSLWIDTETKRVLRIEQSHDDIPPGFPVTLAENAVDYDWVSIAGTRYLLPVRAEVLLGRDQDRYYTRNVIEFRNYRKFESELKIIDDEPPKNDLRER